MIISGCKCGAAVRKVTSRVVLEPVRRKSFLSLGWTISTVRTVLCYTSQIQYLQMRTGFESAAILLPNRRHHELTIGDYSAITNGKIKYYKVLMRRLPRITSELWTKVMTMFILKHLPSAN